MQTLRIISMISARSSLLFTGLFASLLFMGAGCFITLNPSDSANAVGDGGVFKSEDRGDKWVQKNSILSTTAIPVTFNGASIATLVQDPQDTKTLYVGTNDNGLFYSTDGAESWQQPTQLNRGRIPAIAVDPRDKCTLYVAAENKLLKSNDCARSWVVVYLDPRVDKRVMSAVVDPSRSATVWLATSTGDLLRSNDGGSSWTSVRNFSTLIVRIAFYRGDSRRMFVATKSAGLFRSDDAGVNWLDLSKNYPKAQGGKDFFDLSLGSSDPDTVVIASRLGLLRSKDAGNTWELIPLLTAPGTTLIYSVAVDPQNVSKIIYGTSTTFYRTDNAGVNWTPKKMPTSRAATSLLVDRLNGNLLYMGTTKFQ